MRDRLIYFDKLNNYKSEELFNKALNSIKNNEYNFYYLFPNGELLTRYRDMFLKRTGGNFKINLFTFDDIVLEILLDRDYEVMNEEIKLLVIKSALDKLNEEKKLETFKKSIDMPGFIKSMSLIIGTIKRSLLDVEGFKNKIPKIKTYEEIGMIYEYYQKELEKFKLIDREDLYFKAIERLDKDNVILKDVEYIIIDQFYDFRPVELKILEGIAKLDIDVYINIPFKFKEGFSLIEDTIRKLESYGYKRSENIKIKENDFINLASSLYSYERENIEINSIINIISAPNKYLEIKKIFESIKKEYLLETDLRDICITMTSDDYKDIIIKVAEEEKIPISLNKSFSLIENKLIKELLIILQSPFTTNMKDLILNRIQLDYFKIVDDEIKYDLYTYIRSKDFDSLNSLQEKIDKEKEFKLSENALLNLYETIDIIKSEKLLLSSINSISEFNNYIKDIINKYKIEDQIRSTIKKDVKEFKKLQDIYKNLVQVLDDIKKYDYIIDHISIKRYYELLLNNLEETHIIIRKGNVDGVQILDIIDNRGIEFKMNYIVGLSQEEYPKVENKNFLLNEKNNGTLKKIGLNIMNKEEKVENEVIKFSSIIGNTKEKLYLSYTSGEEGDIGKSIFIEEIIRLIPSNIKLTDVKLDYLLKNKMSSITTKKELEWILLTDIKRGSVNKLLLEDYLKSDKKKIYEINKKIISEYNRNYDRDSEYNGIIGTKKIKRYLKDYNKDRIYSSSFLERYSKCPYSFLLERILKLEETYEEEVDYDPLLVGNIYHRTLKLFYELYNIEIIKTLENKTLDLDYYSNLLKDIFNKTILEFGLNYDNSKSKLLLDTIYIKLDNFLKEDLKRLEKFKLKPYAFEDNFGKDKDFNIELEGEKLYIKGTVDRLDKTIDGKTIIIDYKSGSSNYRLKDMKEGLSLQLPIYIMAYEKNNPISAIYGEIGSASFQLGLSLSDKSFQAKGIRNNKIIDLKDQKKFFEFIKERIFNIKDEIFQGNFPVKPKECSDYCEFKNICRYDDKRELII